MSIGQTRVQCGLVIFVLAALCMGAADCAAGFGPPPSAPSSLEAIGDDRRVIAQLSDAEDDIPKNPVPQTAQAGTVVEQISYKTPWEFYLAGFTILLGIGFMALYCFAHRGTKLDHAFSRNFIILTVIFSALFLIVAGYSERQTAPVFGLLGTIVGYLFGAVAGKAQAQIDAEAPGQAPGSPGTDGRKT